MVRLRRPWLPTARVGHEGGLAYANLGHRLVWCRNSETTQDDVRTAGQNQTEDAQSQVLQEVCSDHEQDRQGGASCRVACTAYGACPCRQRQPRPSRRRLDGVCQASTRAARSRGGWPCMSATRSTRAGSSRLWSGQRQSGMSSWTTWNCTRHGDDSNDWRV